MFSEQQSLQYLYKLVAIFDWYILKYSCLDGYFPSNIWELAENQVQSFHNRLILAIYPDLLEQTSARNMFQSDDQIDGSFSPHRQVKKQNYH